MNQVAAQQEEGTPKAQLPIKDWFLFPLLVLATIVLIAVCSEITARRLYPDSVGSLNPCHVHNNNPAGARATPDSVCWDKIPEGEITEYKFNGCGDRAGMECGAKPRDVYRIVMTGTSVAMGRYVSAGNSFGSLLPAKLSRLTGHPVEVYNASMMQGFLESIPLRLDEILADKPDMVLWVVTPTDLREPSFIPRENPSIPLPESAGGALSAKRAWYLLKIAFERGSILALIRDHFDRTRTALMLRHLAYRSQSVYLKSYLMASDEEAGFLRRNLSTEWRYRLGQFDKDEADVERWSKRTGVPIAVVLVPNRALAAMVSMREWPQGYDPYKLGDELRSIVVRHGGTYIDMVSDFRDIPNPERLYFPVDGHPDVQGHATIARLLAKELANRVGTAVNAPVQKEDR
jgi:hypothetical protein